MFLRAALVRVKGEMAGYLSDSIGIVDYKDGEDTKHIFFHVDGEKLPDFLHLCFFFNCVLSLQMWSCSRRR